MCQPTLYRIIFAIATCGFLSAVSATEHDAENKTLRWRASAADTDLQVTLVPGQTPVPLGRHHHWTARVERKDGTPVAGARLAVAGGMRGHGHGMPTQPQVKATSQPGTYRIDGMMFNMYGLWNVLVHIRTDTINTTVDIPVRLEY